jgi:hypothetical protein
VANYIYLGSTANNNLRNHLYKQHAEEYDRTVLGHQWKYKLSTQSSNAASGNVRDRSLPQFSPVAFLEHLVRFIVADDQVSPNNLVFFHALTCL